MVSDYKGARPIAMSPIAIDKKTNNYSRNKLKKSLQFEYINKIDPFCASPLLLKKNII